MQEPFLPTRSRVEPRGGCVSFPGFVSASEREDIAAWIETHVMWSCGTSQGNRLETWVERQRLLPEWSRALGARMIEEGIFDEPPDYLHLIHYEAGRGIAMHMDHEFLGTAVAGLTEIQPCVRVQKGTTAAGARPAPAGRPVRNFW